MNEFDIDIQLYKHELTSGQDSTIRTWKNFTEPDEEILWTAMRHENHTGRFHFWNFVHIFIYQ